MQTVEIPCFEDADGMDEWNLTVFDVGNPSEPLKEAVGTFATCVKSAVLFMAIRILTGQFRQFRVVIERIC